MGRRKQFYLAATVTALALLLGWILLVQNIVGQSTPGTRAMFAFAAKKRELAQKTGSPKMVLIGGSNVFYGLSASMLSADLLIPTVNCGVSAVWGPEYMFWDGKRHLKKGDIVVFFPEFGQYAYEGTPNVTMLEYVVARDRDYLEAVSLPTKLRLYFSYDPRTLKKQTKAKEKGGPEDFSKEQARLNINGDLVEFEPVKEEDLAKRSTICQELFSELPSKKYRVLVKEFKSWCDENGILFLVGCPSLYGHSTYSSPVVDENFQRIRKFYEEEGVPFLGNPRDFFYGLQYMYDTRDHLNEAGRDIRTRETAKLLAPYVKRWLEKSNSAPDYGLGIQ